MKKIVLMLAVIFLLGEFAVTVSAPRDDLEKQTKEIQEFLKDKGPKYDPGKIDRQYGNDTARAILKYIKEPPPPSNPPVQPPPPPPSELTEMAKSIQTLMQKIETRTEKAANRFEEVNVPDVLQKLKNIDENTQAAWKLSFLVLGAPLLVSIIAAAIAFFLYGTRERLKDVLSRMERLVQPMLNPPAPVVRVVDPNTKSVAALGPDVAMEIFGENFLSGAQALIDRTLVGRNNTTMISGTHLRVIIPPPAVLVPAGGQQQVDVTVINPDGRMAVPSVRFTYLP